jgi:hypothetical protein
MKISKGEIIQDPYETFIFLKKQCNFSFLNNFYTCKHYIFSQSPIVPALFAANRWPCYKTVI